MTTATKPLAAPKDNLLGICNALGEDFGFNPLWLRLVLGTAFVIQPVGVVIGYLALGLVVLVSRLAFPNARARKHEEPVIALPASQAAVEQDDGMIYAKAA
ncbi:PspC domain-containing protein [Sphingomonas radiodurans]|uniref:PspC domain-containing protein n=1 Tax=Sphingomonas radiodurans TaxID=2890321 RepID=UPI001E5BF0A9|nr:PspC domain-containing protein [Sphingomonas radiodurans]WBH17503.1 PspC domain-containing protein [Sphingomonas radiodurans]